MESALKLMDLERQTGKTYGEIVKDFGEKTRQVEDLEEKAKSVQREIQELRDMKAKLEGEIREFKKRRSAVLQGLNRIIAIEERLKRLGLEKVSDLARFVEDFQLLGFDVNAVRRLAEWRKSLAKMEIDPDGLEKFIGEKGSFEEQISRLRSEEAAERRKLKLLKETRLRLWNQVASLQSEASRLSCLSTVLKKRRMLLACKYCGMGILAELPTRAAVKNGMIENVWCPYCGRWVQYNPHDILSQIGWLVLPK